MSTVDCVLNEFRKAYQELLELSAREEAMKNETAEFQRNSPLFREHLGQREPIVRLVIDDEDGRFERARLGGGRGEVLRGPHDGHG